MDDWRIERLSRSHKRDQFSCGKASLDDFLRTLAGRYDKRRLGRTYVAVKEGDQRVFGYYTLASSAIAYKHFPPETGKKLPRHPVPVILLARLAVDQSVRGKRLGERLLVDALKRSLELSDSLGVHAVEVDAIDSEARNFSAKYGFVALSDRELHLYLPMESIRRSFQDV